MTLRGSGPTTIPQSTLTILIPGKTNETGEFYYLYPIRSSVSGEDPVISGLINFGSSVSGKDPVISGLINFGSSVSGEDPVISGVVDFPLTFVISSR